ncbi:MAG: hypothetical protein IKC97_03955 [Clostridia bacterium]|nr:hypothetical protein [Clostridia bacterium]
MSKNFEKLKTKLRLGAIIRFLAFGIALGVLTAAGFAIVQKLAAISPDPLLCIGAGIGVALVAIVVALLVAFPTEKRVAKRLDDQLSLREKVQTMIAFYGDQSAMTEIQREDTERILGTVTGKQLRRKRVWLNAVLPVLAVALLLTAFVLPVRTEGATPGGDFDGENEIWELTEWHITAVRALIDMVKSSDMVEDGKSSVVETLEKMLADLEYVTTKTHMKQTVMSAMVKIDAVTDGINTYTPLVRAMRNAASLKLKELAEAMGTPVDPIIESKYQALKASFEGETFKEDINSLAASLSVAVDAAKVAKTDALYVALQQFSESLAAFAKTVDELGEEERATALTHVFESAAEQMSVALSQQGSNRATTDTVNNELMSIFGIAWNELPDELKYSDDEEASTEDNVQQEQEDEVIGGGGKGSGEVIYGSDDAIYYPKDETHVKYGDVIDEYNGQKVTDMEERSLSDEIKAFIDKYFADLYYKDKND